MSARLWNHNIHYHGIVLASTPPGCRRALDVGCGQGLLARELAQHCNEVTAIDADHETLARAQAACSAETRITFVEGDVMTYPFPSDSFDLITVVATLHHLPLRASLARFRNLLRSGGVLAIIGLYRAHTLRDYTLAAVALPVSYLLRCVRGNVDVGAPLRDPAETLQEIRSACDSLLPSAVFERHLFFRYSVIWRKP